MTGTVPPIKIHPKHPRLLFRADEVEAIRKRCREPFFAPIYAEMKRWADERIAAKDGKGDMVTFGFLYQMEGDKKYAEEAKRRLGAFKAWAGGFYGPYYDVTATYDLVHDALTPEERRDFAGRLVKMCSTGWKPSFIGLHRISTETPQVLAVWGDEGVDMKALRVRFKEECEAIYSRWIPRGNKVADHWGGWHRSFECQCWPKYVPRFAEMWLNATGEDIFDNRFIRSHGAWYLYHTLPGFRDARALRLVPDSYSEFPAAFMVNHWESTLILGKRLNEGLSMWWWKQPLTRSGLWGPGGYGGFFETLSVKPLTKRSRDQIVSNGVARRLILYYDPKVEELLPESFPEDAYHRSMGLVSTRSGWDDQAAFAWFHCGRLTAGKPDDLDSNGFFIYRNGYLATDGWPPTKSAHSGYELDNYRRRTIAHNLITVYDPNEPASNFRSQYPPSEKATSNDGGQLGQHKLVLDPELHPWKEEGHVNIYKPNAFIRAFRTTPEYCYVLGDATQAYSPHKMKFFTRQFVFLKPDIFVVFDRVVSTKAEFRKTWHIHPMEKPEVKGGTFRWKACRPTSRYFKEPYPLGWLVGRTLLPERAEVEVIGGKGKECWVNGKNYHEVRDRRKERDESDWEHSWRIDVKPAEAAEEDLFLHVLQTFPDTPSALAKVRLVEALGTAGAAISHGERAWTVSFPRDGEAGGRISLAAGGKAVLDEALPKKVEETYVRWKDDPRYRSWAGDPRYRIVVPEVDRVGSPKE